MENLLDPVISFILSQQEADGSFPTYESYPVVNPQAGWTKLPDSSPFITANIIASLQQLNEPRLKESVARAAKNLLQSKEGAGFWRFWPVKSKQHAVPLDMDDTCIVLFVLEQCGYHFNHKNILLNNKNTEGYFETWLKPRLSNFFISPAAAFMFVNDYRVAYQTMRLKHFAYDDKEPAVAANVVLYLGERHETKACIDEIIKEVKSAAISKQFYDDDVVVYYHIARAFVNGINSFKQLGPLIAERMNKRFGNNNETENEMLLAIAANVLLDFNIETGLAKKMVEAIVPGKSHPGNWLCYPYFRSKDRNFLSGSPALTAAVFAEAFSKLNRLKP